MAFYISFFLSICLLTYGLVGMRAERKGHIQKRIHAYFVTNTSPHQPADPEEERSFYQRVLKPFSVALKRRYTKRLDKEKASKLEYMLLQAGQPFGFSPVEFKMAQLLLTGLLPLMGAGIALLSGLSIKLILLITFLSLGAAVIYPKLFLKKKIQKRSQIAGKELPDILDLLTISLEAGLGFDAALSKVVSKKQGEVIKEFKIALEEMRLGQTRKEALNSINDRLSSSELKGLIYNIIQAEKLGVGMVSVLRVQTEEIREYRRQKAEETAMKAPIKMMFPLVLFIFPTLFIVLLGPAMIQLLGSL